MLVCVPHASDQDWHSIDSMSSIEDTKDVHTIVVHNSDLSPTNLLKFERNVISRAPSLESLMMTASKVAYIPNLQHSTELKGLNASFNEIDRLNAFEFSGTNLLQLDLSHNRISIIHENAFNDQRLFGRIEFIFGLRLLHLHLQNNRLTRIQVEWFQNLKNLQMIDLRNNFIANIYTQTFSNLKALDHVVHVKFDGHEVEVKDGISRIKAKTKNQ